ncbi:tRNA (adenosine(37)-N6)-threonylcarbamoyltransferase complex dimerization subunit type 1 TsaB [Microbacterium azadirachtae]|uniref:tRNA (adenosine(37)-N6)-threonylcarbamoyltransferase complex dimerization subunit type 1 TsaB n=1 Tax=Microbacterium azadirachtae TaxID=582680 RepID=UPI0021D4DDD7|nr:tRNA (adenosine(37)-N6)-threonylcarbamoyltransferase complex dimerization subunit type 1 TsaB [Microbacterium azadirachtae]UXW85183.1 tRNA (adenosine(37)-N6)-threonylcarbamoyltransferase complex dimerization subunit type 1 TsaB [Microbacterium azadirachtae]
MILGVDTSLGSAVGLIGRDGRTVAEVSQTGHLGHAEAIGALLEQVLAAAPSADAGAAPTDEAAAETLTHVAAGMGPGPFTGLRIGIAAARAFALGRGVPVIAVPSHHAAALAVIESDAPAEPFAILTDARRRETAVTVYEGIDVDGIPHAVVDTVLVPQAEVDRRLGALRRIEVTEISGAVLARVARRAVAAGRTLTGSEPLYLRPPDARVPAAPKKVGS